MDRRGRLFIQLSGLNGFAVIDFAQRKEVARVVFPDVANDADNLQRAQVAIHVAEFNGLADGILVGPSLAGQGITD